MKQTLLRNLLFLLLPLSVACVREPDWVNPMPGIPEAITDLIAPSTFDYATTLNRTIEIRVLDGRDVPMESIPVEIYTAPPAQGGVLITRGVSEANGVFRVELPMPIASDSVFIRTPYPGLASSYQMKLTGSHTGMTMGGETPLSDPHVVVYQEEQEPETESVAGGQSFSSRYKYMGPYDNQGVPTYKLPVRDYISQDLLDLVNNSLPESRPVPTWNPEYIAEDVVTDTRLQDSAEVFITFVHEGAGWKNAVGYYTYDMSSPPATSDDIDTLYIIYPNVSYSGSGGGMQSGDKVKLGNFPANTGIGWFLVPNGWNGSNVGNSTSIKFSNKEFNTFTNPASRSHIALLRDTQRELLLMGFEDTSRPGGDNDFNDAVFYVTANPFEAIIVEDMPETEAPEGDDQDEDGVNDDNDDYPDDPERAFNVYVPGINTFGTLAFEDLWPFRGDYDMNDLVVDYNFHLQTNTANKVVQMDATFVVKAVGASGNLGFGFVLNVPSTEIESVSGNSISGNSLTFNANGTEANQSKSVIMVFDDAHQAMGQAPGKFINTEMQSAKVALDTITVTIEFTQAQVQSALGYAPYNPFIFTGRGRGHEVHLPDFEPTDLADTQIFGTGNDDSNPGTGRYYKDNLNLPFALHMPVSFVYPVERQPIHQAHLMFSSWVQSGGLNFTDWYSGKTGYRDNSKLYTK